MADVDIPDLDDIGGALADDAEIEISQSGDTFRASLKKLGAILGMGGFRYDFDSSTTAGDPGSGHFRLNAAYASATAAYIDDIEFSTVDLSGFWDDLTSGYFTIVREGNAKSFAIYKFTAIADSSGYRTLTLEFLAGGGTFSNTDHVRVFIGAGGGGGGGGLVNFDESEDATGLNTSVPQAELIPNNAAADVDLVLSPKGVGALEAHPADGTTAGGDKRGQNATDWQRDRTDSSSVASGSAATIVGGSDNKVDGDGGVAGGVGNTVSGSGAVAFGTGNQATGQGAVALGETNHADALDSIAFGTNARTKGLSSFAEQFFGDDGDAQTRRAIFRAQTTDNTQTPATTNRDVESSGVVLTLDNNSTYAVRATAVARRPSNGDSKAWSIDFLIKRGANAAATSVVGSPAITDIAADAGASSWSIDVAAETTIGAARFLVTGANSQTIDWVIALQSVECVSI